MNALDLAKTGGMFDGEAAGNIGWANELQQNVSIWSIHNCYLCSNDSSTIGFLNKGNMLKPWFVSSIDNPITKRIITW